jgi:hypothetical protein
MGNRAGRQVGALAGGFVSRWVCKQVGGKGWG